MSDRIKIPTYSKGEEIMNMVTHIVGGGFAVVALVLCVVRAAIHHNVAGVVSGAIYGISMIMVYTISSIYHGLNPEKVPTGKKVLRVIDHCDIYGLIMGSFAPLALTGLRKVSPVMAWVSFGVVCLTAVVGIVFTAVDMGKFRAISYAAYFVAGWSVLMTAPKLIEAYGLKAFLLILTGGVIYTSGMIFYVFQKKGYKYCHSIFHIFILFGTAVQFISIFIYCM